MHGKLQLFVASTCTAAFSDMALCKSALHAVSKSISLSIPVASDTARSACLNTDISQCLIWRLLRAVSCDAATSSSKTRKCLVMLGLTDSAQMVGRCSVMSRN